jgi:hypothetical protein
VRREPGPKEVVRRHVREEDEHVYRCMVALAVFQFFFVPIIVTTGEQHLPPANNLYPARTCGFAGIIVSYRWRMHKFAGGKTIPPASGSPVNSNSPGVTLFGASAVGFWLVVVLGASAISVHGMANS